MVRSRQLPPRTRAFVLIADRIVEGALLGSLVWLERGERPLVAALALVALGVSGVAAYERARGVALGYRVGEGVAYAVVRYALAAAAVATRATEFLWVFVGVVAAAGIVRAWGVAAQERRLRATAGGRA